MCRFRLPGRFSARTSTSHVRFPPRKLIILSKLQHTIHRQHSGTVAGTWYPSLQLADLDGDHIPDLILGDGMHGGIQVFLGNGNGSFRAPVPYGAGIFYQIAAADVNGDGKQDLVWV